MRYCQHFLMADDTYLFQYLCIKVVVLFLVTRIPLSQVCSVDDVCADSTAVCIDGSCQCSENYFLADGPTCC